MTDSMTAGWRVRFWPQAWQNDYAIDVDPEGEVRFGIGDEEAADARKEIDRRGGFGVDLDHFINHPNAPEWIRNWHGPFYFDLVEPDGFVYLPKR
jgi:hypothetical protein